MVDYTRDVGHFAHADAETGKPTLSETLCAFRAGEWCVLTPALPRQRDVRDQAWEPDAPWSVTHAPSGLRVAMRGDLWRAILLCEECALAYGHLDPRTATQGENVALHKRAAQRAEERERMVVARVFTCRVMLVEESGEYPLKEDVGP
jgi:hypothetical protein